MPKHYSNCLFVHGLHSNVNQDKVAIMEKYFPKVTARYIQYGSRPDAYNELKDICRKEKVDFIIGSSFGAYLGFYLSRELQLPAILFNPALFFRDQDTTFVIKEIHQASPFSLFVIGEKDDVIPPGSIDLFLEKNKIEDNIRIIRCEWVEHRIDLKTFEAMISCGLVLSTAD